MSKSTLQSSHSRRIATVGLVAALATAGLVATTSNAQAATTSETAAANSVLSLLNSQRAANHLPALKMSSALITSARRHNLTMAKANTLSHQLPNEPVFSTRISQAGVSWHSVSENIGWTSDKTAKGANSLESMMYAEKAPNDGHRVNIMSKSVHFVGIDTYIDAKTGKLWLTEDFADVAGPATKAPAKTAAVVPATHKPFGTVDKAIVYAGHKVQLVGWAVDPDNRAKPLAIAVYADGKGLARFNLPAYRPDVAKAKKAGSNQGFKITVVLPAGVHTVTAYAINTGAGSSNTTLGSKKVRA